jgi:gamma-glutamylputrescine oxidase
MDILTINDTPGHHPDSWYAATATPPGPYPSARGDVRCDICVVGGGYTGVSAALHLARAGYRVVLIEASRVGFGASGRNGGHVSMGQRLAQDDLESMLGETVAHKLWDLGSEAVTLVKDLIRVGNMECGWQDGVIHANHRGRYTAHSQAQVAHMHKAYGYDKIRYLDRAAIQQEVGTPHYVSGTLDMGSGHLHPLRYMFGLARMAAEAGVSIHENSRMLELVPGSQPKVKTEHATITADHVVLGLNGYHNNAVGEVAARVMPINNFIVATEPLGEARAKDLIRNNHAVADSRFVINYFRLSHDYRMIFGGGESYGYRFPADLVGKVRKPMLQVFPQLADARVDHAWGGTLAITVKRLPHFARLHGNVISASGYSGQGVALATLAGKLVSEAVRGQAERFDVMAQLPTPRFPGGVLLRTPLLVTAMLWFSMRDRL